LANAGLRMSDAAVLARLWEPRMIEAKSVMPPFQYLFEVRKIGRTPSPYALAVKPEFAAPPGYEIVPLPAARALAAYVANLRQAPFLFEAPPPPGTTFTNAAGTNTPTLGTNAAPVDAGLSASPGSAQITNPQSAIRNPQSSNAPSP
jgi:hypothetical protein